MQEDYTLDSNEVDALELDMNNINFGTNAHRKTVDKLIAFFRHYLVMSENTRKKDDTKITWKKVDEKS